jgi:hypothetical protein
VPMKFLSMFVPALLLPTVMLGNIGGVVAQPLDARPQIDKRQVLIDSYEARLKTLQATDDLEALLKLLREWQKEINNPIYPTSYIMEAYYVYKSGDIDQAIKLLQNIVDKEITRDPQGKELLNTALTIRRNFPDLQLKPFEFVDGESAAETTGWRTKAMDLIAAKNYDEIEKIAAALQQSKATDEQGWPYLSRFFQALITTRDGGFPAIRKQISAWREARPESNLARLAEIAMWNRAAADGMGGQTPPLGELADPINEGTKGWAALPKEAFESPLAIEVGMARSQVAGLPRPFADDLFRSGSTKFPDYMPLYRIRTLALLPRWYGKSGEAEEMLKTRADAIGGEAGDIFYGQVLWNLTSTVGEMTTGTKFDFARAERGLELLNNRLPESISVPTARLALAIISANNGNLQKLLTAPRGHLIDQFYYLGSNPSNRMWLRDFRMSTLAKAVPDGG